MAENRVETAGTADTEPVIEEPRDCCAPGRAAFLQPTADHSDGA